MNMVFKLVAIATMSLTLNGCFEVEDNNNNDNIIAALEQAQVIKNPITLYGTVVDAGSQTPVDEISISVKVGNEWRPAITVSSEFSIEELPVNTDVVVLIQSPTEAFLERAFFGRTTTAEQNQVALQSMGELQVSKGVAKTYSILESESSEVFEGIVFNYNTATTFSNYYAISGIGSYQQVSTFDDETGMYSITLPKDLSFSLKASGDIDGDGVNDYQPENNNFGDSDGIYLSSQEAHSLVTMYVDVVETYQPVELRVSLIDKLGEHIEGAEFFANDTFLGRQELSYDADTNEYVFNYQSSGQVELNMASFTSSDDVNYRSGSLRLNRSSAEELSIYETGFDNYSIGNVSIVEGVASVILQPTKMTTSNQSVSVVSSVIDSNANSSLKQFYQSPIGLVENSVTLTQQNVFKVIKGNDSPNDTVPAGTTVLGNTNVNVEVTASLSHNNTFLTAAPIEILEAGEYRYNVNELINRESNYLFASYWSTNFTVEAENTDVGIFNINQIKLDNNNGTTNGVVIVSENTAGEASTVTNNSSYANLYLPISILSLDYFELTLVNTVRNGYSQSSNGQISIINNGNLSSVYKRNLVSLAQNETVQSFSGNYYSSQADTLTALLDGEWFKRNNSILYASDNVDSSVNTATFSYIYRVAGEESIVEGSITLPVL